MAKNETVTTGHLHFCASLKAVASACDCAYSERIKDEDVRPQTTSDFTTQAPDYTAEACDKGYEDGLRDAAKQTTPTHAAMAAVLTDARLCMALKQVGELLRYKGFPESAAQVDEAIRRMSDD